MVERADAFVFVTPEYNYGYNAVLKNAIDFLFHEWADKAVSFVSYGGIGGGGGGDPDRAAALDPLAAPRARGGQRVRAETQRRPDPTR